MLGANVSLMRALPMPYVESLRVFVRIVELGSITSGGRDLRLTPAVASKRIKELERHLGVRLFNRTTRSLTPTEVGRVFYDHARQALTALDEAEAVVANFSSVAGWCETMITVVVRSRSLRISPAFWLNSTSVELGMPSSIR